jgi:hypothetical protein
MMRLILLFAAAGLCHGANYYVDSANGKDSNDGASAAAPWHSLAKVNSAGLQPGDRVLFRGGQAWRGQLAPTRSGRPGAPIVIDRYGDGPRPRIDGAGEVADTILLRNVQHIEVRNLEVTNLGATPAVRRGVHISLDNFGTATHIVVAGLFIHDVNGSNQPKDNGGIIFRTVGDKTPSRFDDLRIERNVIWKVDRSAIAAQSYHARRTRWFPSRNVIIRDNLVDDIGGDGIVPWATDGVLVEHNIARNCNRRAGSYNAGIWPWSTDNSLFQLNEASLTRTTKDGQGFDSDFNSTNTLFQYNFSHDNEGGFMLICTPGKRNQQENVGNHGTIVRYNISRNDKARVFHVSGGTGIEIRDNAIYPAPEPDTQLLLLSDWQGWAAGVAFRNNSVYGVRPMPSGHAIKRNDDGTYGAAEGWGGATDVVVDNTRYPADAPRLSWSGPQFDPAGSDDFDRFIDQHRAWLVQLMERQFGRPVKLGR